MYNLNINLYNYYVHFLSDPSKKRYTWLLVSSKYYTYWSDLRLGEAYAIILKLRYDIEKIITCIKKKADENKNYDHYDKDDDDNKNDDNDKIQEVKILVIDKNMEKLKEKIKERVRVRVR